MALTESTMLPLGTLAPDFRLRDVVSGKPYDLESFLVKKALLVMFICRHCPYVKHIEKELGALGRDYAGSDLGIVAISSNDAKSYPEDAPNSLKQQAQLAGFSFPYLYDENQETAKAYGAACTPDFYLFDRERRMVYRGQMDGSRPGNGVPNDGRDLRVAIEAVLAGLPVSTEQKPSMGCNIKWKSSR